MKKLTSIDYLRAISMLYVVGYWHLFDYSSASLGHDNVAMEYVRDVVLAVFVLISGFLLGGESTRRLSALQFYRKRLLRVYPLYVLALALFFIFGMSSAWTSFKGVLGVSMLLQPPPLTLWFVTMLVLFYLITPLLLALVERVPAYIAVTGGMLVGTVLFQFAFDSVDPRLMLYFPSFCLGIYCANHGLNGKLANPVTASLALAVGIGLTLVSFSIETLNYLKEVPLVMAAAYLIVYLGIKNERHFKELSLISFLSYSSFAMYLFHRIVYTSLVNLYFPATPSLQIAYLMTIGLLVTALFSWSAQKLYDLLYAALQARWGPPQKMAV